MSTEKEKQLAALNKLSNFGIEEVSPDIYKVKVSGLNRTYLHATEVEMLVDFTYVDKWAPYASEEYWDPADTNPEFLHPIVILKKYENHSSGAAHIQGGRPSPRLQPFASKEMVGQENEISYSHHGLGMVNTLACYEADWFTKAVKDQDLFALANGIQTCFRSVVNTYSEDEDYYEEFDEV